MSINYVILILALSVNSIYYIFKIIQIYNCSNQTNGGMILPPRKETKKFYEGKYIYWHIKRGVVLRNANCLTLKILFHD